MQVGGVDLESARGELAREHLGECAVARDVVLPQLALRLVDRHRGARAEIRPHELGIDLALVQRMPVLVQGAQQRLHVTLAVARRHTRVTLADPRGERMRGDVDAPASLVDPQRAQHARHRRPLRLDRGRHRDRRRLRARLLDQWRQRARELAEDAAYLGRAQPEVVVAEQPLVRRLGRVRDAFAVGARELHVALEIRRERREVVLRPCALPAVLSLGVRVRELARELVRDLARPLPVAPREAHDVALALTELRVIELLEPPAELRRRRALVCQARDCPELVRACRAAFARHHHELVPLRERLQRVEIRKLGDALEQLRERLRGRGGGHRCAS